MKRLALGIGFLVSAFVVFQMVMNNTIIHQIDPQDPIDFVYGFITTPSRDLGTWFWNNLFRPLFKHLAFPLETTFDFLLRLGSRSHAFWSELFDSQLLSKISGFFTDVQNFFLNFWDNFSLFGWFKK